MKLNAYTIYDVASGTYMRPFFAREDGEAMRGFNDIATDANHEVGKHPEDYTLYRVGTLNDNTGKMIGEDLEKLRTGLECIAAGQQIQTDALQQLDKAIQNGETN